MDLTDLRTVIPDVIQMTMTITTTLLQFIRDSEHIFFFYCRLPIKAVV